MKMLYLKQNQKIYTNTVTKIAMIDKQNVDFLLQTEINVHSLYLMGGDFHHQ